MEKLPEPINDFLDKASIVALQEAQGDLELARLEISRLSCVIRDTSAECSHLRNELSRTISLQEKEKEDTQHQLTVLRQQLEQALASLREKEAEANVASEDAELILLQLHQVQEELERYFLVSRRQSEMLSASSNISKKAFALISAIA
ncbi:hypothetical protein KR52_01505 [Synechococcus sp. KORDI-52]|uniref:hypothetical protein n=1 Tax=Synechococcus sp. KORDI-52 TaxID=585425 RepID=UPI0004E06723|nr:hypothetical protein [Synechococcus sp. KORDI-52]AII47840.1 hypothetical protein KR52_01505 [Synechococcus sp. KORDI-52]